jgi:hypothetical protein
MNSWRASDPIKSESAPIRRIAATLVKQESAGSGVADSMFLQHRGGELRIESGTGSTGAESLLCSFVASTSRSRAGAAMESIMVVSSFSPVPGAVPREHAKRRQRPRWIDRVVASREPNLGFSRYVSSRTVLAGGCPALDGGAFRPPRRRPRAD